MDENKEENEYLIEFSKPFTFEGTEYKSIDLSDIENLKTKDLAEADKTFISTGQMALMNEMSIGYACIVASIVSKKPISFFDELPAKEGIKIKTVISSFLFN